MKKRLFQGAAVLALVFGGAVLSFGASGVRFGFSLSGGLGNIDGGDFNHTIRDYNQWVSDFEDYWNENTYAVDWKEMKWLPKFGGEVFLRFGKSFGIGLGAEFIKKTNPGTIHNGYEDSLTEYHVGYYEVFEEIYNSDTAISQTLTVIPITLSFYGFLPIGRMAEAYVKLGGGYYLGKLTSDRGDDAENIYNDNFYWNSGAPYPPHNHAVISGTSAEYWEATCNTFGFHFGAGFNFNISSNIALFGEAFYRLVNFKDWRGSLEADADMHMSWGWTNSTEPTNLPNSDSISYNEDYNGQLWFYEDIWNELDTGAYGGVGLFEDEPATDTWTKNVRPAEINLNGFTFKVGIKIFFGGR